MIICIAHLHSDTLGIYWWSEIQLILNMGGGVKRISQQTPTNPQINPQTVVCSINEALSLTKRAPRNLQF
jgi:hypothetical protein